MLKGKLIVDLNEDGAKALRLIMDATGMKRSQIVHQVLLEEARRVGDIVDEGAAARLEPVTVGMMRPVEAWAAGTATKPFVKVKEVMDEAVREVYRASKAVKTDPRTFCEHGAAKGPVQASGVQVNWQPIETAPKDGTLILIYWESYAYCVDEKGGPLIALGLWKTNYRLVDRGIDELPKMAASYFSDSYEWDDYGLALPEHAPTHWMPLPEPPTQAEVANA